jgi:hypothetical protein
MRATVQGFQGAANWTQCFRSRHYCDVPFRYARFVIATFYQTGASLPDTDLPNSYTFQVGLEYPFTLAFSGIANRLAVTFGSANSATYVSGTGPEGYMLSDVVDFGSTVPAGTFFGLWTTVENVAGVSSPAGTLPYQFNASNNYQSGWQRYQGATSSTTTSLVGANTALTASSISAVGNGVGGYSLGFTPVMMLIKCPSETRSIFSVGDCLGFGNNEGNTGSLTYGDCQGSALTNVGFMERYVHEVLNHPMVNFCRGSDKFGYYSATNWKYRLALLALANPTHIFNQYGHNDIAGGASLGTVLASAQAMYAGMKAAVPGVPIIQMCQTPASTSTDTFATTANQTAQTPGWGSSSSVRGQFDDTYIRTNGSALGNGGYVDPNVALEYLYSENTPSSESSIWIANGTASAYTGDGVHPNSYGHYLAAQGMLAYRNGSSVADPFAS